MAFPVVNDSDTQSGTQNTNSSSWTGVTYPTNIAAGDLLLLFVGADGNQAIAADDAGFTSIRQLPGSGNACRLAALAKRAAGTESGTFTVTLAGSEQGVWRIVRITGWRDSGTLTSDVEAGGDATGSSAAADPGSFNPTNWDAEDTLWFAATALDGGNSTVTGFPTDYTNGFSDNSVGGQGAAMGTARRALAAASDDPGAFANTDTDWGAFVVAVRPAAGTQYTKAGAGVAAMAGAGADAISLAEAGLGLSLLTALGADAVEHAEAGAGESPFAGDGPESVERGESGTGVIEMVASGFTESEAPPSKLGVGIIGP